MNLARRPQHYMWGVLDIINMKDVEMEGQNIMAVYMKGNPSRKGACDQLAWRPYARVGKEGISSG